MAHEKERELLKNFSATWNQKTFTNGQSFIHYSDIESFLSTLPEEKEENGYCKKGFVWANCTVWKSCEHCEFNNPPNQ